MKTRVSLFIFCIQMVAVCGFAADKRIDGNGNPETREIKISDYDYERVYMPSGSQLSIQNPATPPIPRNRYIDNRSHAISTNHLNKIKGDTELTTNILYYDDRIKKEGYSLYEQYLPSSDKLIIEEQMRSVSHIHNLELASRLNVNAKNHYLNNAFNLNVNWNSDFGTSDTHSNADVADVLISQRLKQPFLSIDNTLNLIKTIKENTYKIYFSIGYGNKPHKIGRAHV